MTRRARSGSDGFALIEALASLIIVSMIALMLVVGVGTGRRVWERVDARETAGEAVDGAQNAVRRLVEQLYPAALFDRMPPYVDFDGTSGAMTFVASPPLAGRPAPLRRYRLGLNGDGDLVLTSMSDVYAPTVAPPSNEALVRRVRGLDIAYFGAAAPDGVRQWRSAWRLQPTPPELVRVRVAFEPGDRRVWPDLIVRPKPTVDAACALDPGSGGCRGRL